MFYILSILWILIWGAAGYFTVRTIQMRIESKRVARAMAELAIQRENLEKQSAQMTGQRVYNPFKGIL